MELKSPTDAILIFRHPVMRHGLTETIFADVNTHLAVAPGSPSTALRGSRAARDGRRRDTKALAVVCSCLRRLEGVSHGQDRPRSRPATEPVIAGRSCAAEARPARKEGRLGRILRDR